MIRCPHNFECQDPPCHEPEKCRIYRRVFDIALKTAHHNNYGGKSGYHHSVNGRLRFEDIILLYRESFRLGFRCPICQCEMRLGRQKPNSATLDHITPRGAGGKNNIENLRIICLDCNNKKSLEDQCKSNKKDQAAIIDNGGKE